MTTKDHSFSGVLSNDYTLIIENIRTGSESKKKIARDDLQGSGHFSNELVYATPNIMVFMNKFDT